MSHPPPRTSSPGPWRSARAALAALAVGACAALPPASENDGDLNWQRVRMQIGWDRDAAPSWHVDALLAHRVAAPLLAAEHAGITLWRFHRRAADDASGHSFSVLTRASPAINARLCRGLVAAPMMDELRKSGVVERVECEAYPAEKTRLPEAASDGRWSPALQRAWPHFAMGVSETWLRLIDEQVQEAERVEPAPSLPQLLERYRGANEAVTGIWELEGHHAFLHHLNALFGYAPIDLGPDGRRRF